MNCHKGAQGHTHASSSKKYYEVQAAKNRIGSTLVQLNGQTRHKADLQILKM